MSEFLDVRGLTMHTTLVVLAFIAMMMIPCLIAFREDDSGGGYGRFK